MCLFSWATTNDGTGLVRQASPTTGIADDRHRRRPASPTTGIADDRHRPRPASPTIGTARDAPNVRITMVVGYEGNDGADESLPAVTNNGDQ